MARLLSLVAVLALVGCTTTCRFESNAQGAQVYLDGVPKGVTPCLLELSDGETAYTVRLEHPDFETYSYMISQQFAGTVTQQNTQTNVTGQTNAYGSASGRSVTVNSALQGNQNTQTQQYAVYAWPTRYFFTMRPRTATSAPPPTPRPTTPAPPPSEPTPPPSPAPSTRPAFCGSCGARLAAGTKFCGGCGARVEGNR